MIGAMLKVEKNLLPAIASDMDRAEADVINAAIARTHEIATPITPIDSGDLRANVVPNLASPGNPEGSLLWQMEYAAFVHEGTSDTPANPYARNALDQITASWIVKQFRLAGQ